MVGTERQRLRDEWGVIGPQSEGCEGPDNPAPGGPGKMEPERPGPHLDKKRVPPLPCSRGTLAFHPSTLPCGGAGSAQGSRGPEGWDLPCGLGAWLWQGLGYRRRLKTADSRARQTLQARILEMEPRELDYLHSRGI